MWNSHLSKYSKVCKNMQNDCQTHRKSEHLPSPRPSLQVSQSLQSHVCTAQRRQNERKDSTVQLGTEPELNSRVGMFEKDRRLWRLWVCNGVYVCVWMWLDMLRCGITWWDATCQTVMDTTWRYIVQCGLLHVAMLCDCFNFAQNCKAMPCNVLWFDLVVWRKCWRILHVYKCKLHVDTDSNCVCESERLWVWPQHFWVQRVEYYIGLLLEWTIVNTEVQ